MSLYVFVYLHQYPCMHRTYMSIYISEDETESTAAEATKEIDVRAKRLFLLASTGPNDLHLNEVIT